MCIIRQRDEDEADGLSSLPPPGPAIPVTDKPKSVRARLPNSFRHRFRNRSAHCAVFK